jgi:hypothetical protein
MKHPLLLFLFLFPFYAASQSLSIRPNMVETDVDHTKFETVAHSFLTNNSDEEVTIRWSRKVINSTVGWESAICDNNACYATTVDSALMSVILGPGDSTNLDVHIRPNGIEGSAHIDLVAYNINNPDERVEGSFFFNQTLSVSPIELEAIKIYPNPASDYFQLTSYEHVDQVMVYNLVGRHLRTFIAYPSEKFNISDLQRGMYLIRLIDRKKDVIKTLRINKR